MQSDALKRAKAKYNKKVTKVTIEIYPNETEILDKLSEEPSKQAYIKALIRADIARDKDSSLDPIFEERWKAIQKRTYKKVFNEKDLQ